MSEPKRQARLAGVLYLLVAIVGSVGILYLPRNLVVRGDAAATADRIQAAEGVYRLSIASNVVATLLMLFLVLVLYRLLRDVNRTHALMMLSLVVVAVPVSLVLSVLRLAALTIFGGPEFLSVFEKSELDALGYLCLRVNAQGSTVASVLWGLWLLPFGLLVYRSGFIPRVFGVLLLINGVAYAGDALTGLVAPQYAAVVSRFATVPQFVGELAIIVWLLVRGVRERSVERAGPRGAKGTLVACD